MFPRFLKWGIGTLLNKAQVVEFAGAVTFQTDRLRSLECEREMMGLDVEAADRDVADVVDIGANNVGNEDDFVDRVNVDSKLEETLTAIITLKLQNKNKDNMISLLEEEITKLKSKSDLQAVNIFGSFGCVLKMKDEELEKLRKENGEMQKKISLLEDQLEDRDVHVVTQAFRDAGNKQVAGGSGTGCSGYGVPRLGGLNSLVRNIKDKVRKERKLADYEYPLLGVRDRRMGSESDNVGGEKNCVSGNAVIDVDAVEVIDTYTELLKTDQLKVFGNDDQAEKSYFFSSVCLDMVKSADVEGFDKFVRKNISAGTMCRFIHFPMCHNGHWTLVVYDAESGEWKHYNPMRQRMDRVDVHYTEALLLKERVTNVMKQSLLELGMDVLSIESDFDHVLEAVSRCPQQKAESLDCGIIVCAIMRQYMHHCDVERTLQGSNCSVLRANMVKSFVNDPVRGLI
ncbi:hypothetical protein LOK49_LG13G00494 [Camellia lanceoleosa]|uniref:Uncharacterized protein n=1 Tax=Camellia lanceoleosa TaxID=1840588 RepID=A0ACC0FHM1_9ERIC|nr:hypothetical protein LOK49_LG13G00494 [Camellia lanceoleosa]